MVALLYDKLNQFCCYFALLLSLIQQTHTLCCTQIHTLLHTLTHCSTQIQTHKHKRTHTFSITKTLTHTLWHIHSDTNTLTHTLWHTHSDTHSFYLSVNTHKHTHSHTHIHCSTHRDRALQLFFKVKLIPHFLLKIRLMFFINLHLFKT